MEEQKQIEGSEEYIEEKKVKLEFSPGLFFVGLFALLMFASVLGSALGTLIMRRF